MTFILSNLHQHDDYQEAWEERAAIMEYCGGLPRAEAEYRARRCLDNFDGQNQVVDQDNDHDQVDGRSPAARAALSEAWAILRGK